MPREERLGPGGLDPVEVFESLPEALQVGREGGGQAQPQQQQEGKALGRRPGCVTWPGDDVVTSCLQEAFASQDMEKLHKALSDLPIEEAKKHMKACADSGAWVGGRREGRGRGRAIWHALALLLGHAGIIDWPWSDGNCADAVLLPHAGLWVPGGGGEGEEA